MRAYLRRAELGWWSAIAPHLPSALCSLSLALSLAILALVPLTFGLYCPPSLSSPLHGATSLASLHTYPDPLGGTLYRSLQSLRDDHDMAWQAILFKRVQNGIVTAVQLRLVGFPGQIHLAHPTPLVIQGSVGREWILPDNTSEDPSLALATPLENVAQYDARDFLANLERAIPLTMNVALGGDGLDSDPVSHRQLTLPPFVVREWLQLVEAD